MIIETPRTRLLPWRESDRDAFAGLHAHPEVMRDAGGRLVRSAWGHGYATEAARAALHDAFTRCGLREIVAYTAPDNLRSQAVMARLGLLRDPCRDFSGPYGGKMWRSLVWVAAPSD
jgi:RimJ/RimL family protein N-acetyltransferase